MSKLAKTLKGVKTGLKVAPKKNNTKKAGK